MKWRLYIGYTILCCVIIQCFGYSQTQKLSGRVINHVNTPLEFATLNLFKDSILIQSAITDSLGNFILKYVPKGLVKLRAYYIGYAPSEIYLNVIKDTTIIISISTSNKNLKEVTVISKKPLIEKKIDRLTFNVENNLITTGMSADEIFKVIPGVKIDELGTISVNGISGAAVMLNEHLLNLKGNELTSFLQGLHSQDISSIEVIAHPPPSFDAEGVGGIIKIITQKKRTKGFEIGVGSTYKQGIYAKIFNDASMSFKTEKWVVYASLNNSNSNFFFNGNNYRIIENNPYTFFKQSSAISKGNGLGWRSGFEFDIAKNKTIKFETISNLENRNTLSSIVKTQVFLNDILDTTVECLSPFSNKSKSTTYTFNYNWSIDTLGSVFKILSDYSVSNSISHDRSLNSYYNQNNFFLYQINRFGNIGDSLHVYTVQNDINLKLKDKISELQFGMKYSNANNFNGNNYFLYNFANSIWENDSTQTNHFNYRENTLAGYLNFHSKVKHLEYEAGIRIENTQSKSISTTTNTQVIGSYTQFFPDVSLKYSLNDIIGRNISLSYSKRISRPPFIILNPFKYFYDQYTFKQGNPFLQPSIEHSFSAGLSINSKLVFSLNYYLNKNAISDVHLSQGNYTIETFANLSSANGFYLEATYTNDITNWWNSMIDVAYNVSEFRSPNYEQHFRGAILSNTNTIKFNSQLSFQSDFNFSAKGYDRFLKSNYNSAILNIAFQYKFLNKKLLCKIGMNDIFYRQGNMSFTENYQGQTTNTLFKRDTRVFFIGIRYNFKTGVKKENKEIEKSNSDEMHRISK